MIWTQADTSGITRLSPGDPGVRLDFAMGLPAWAWALIAIACVAIAAWCYWHISGSKVWRTVLGALRTATLVLLALLVAGPRLVRQPERTEHDWVVFMADRSLSMGVADVGPDGARETRDSQLQKAIKDAAQPLSKLSSDRQTMWLGFDSGAFDLPAPLQGTPWPEPSGRRTELSHPLEQALQKVAARPVSGIVVFSDGRFASPTSRSVLQRLAAEQIPLFVVPLGSASEMADVAVDRVEAPSRAFVDDIVPVNVRLTRSGAEKAPWAGKVQLVETGTGVVLDEQDLAQVASPADGSGGGNGRPAPSGDLTVSLASKPASAGKLSWTVRVVPDGPDLTENNNSKSLTLDLTDRSLRVVYFDGYPRWEYRYMRGLLVRERSIRSSTLLLSASRRYLQEGSEPLSVIPASDGDWGPIDVVVIGDVRAELFSTEQLESLKNHIARDGAGLLWIGGASATPGSWRDSPLADLLPFSMGRSGEAREPVASSTLPVVLVPTPSAGRLGLLRLGETGHAEWPEALSDPSIGWSRLWWTQRIDAERLKPTAETLAMMTPQAGSEQQWPAVLTMRYGSGRIVYVATDETWRWRFGRGEALYERFWLPIIRLLARESLSASGQSALLEVAPDRPVVEQPVRVSVKLVDEAVASRVPQKLTVRVGRPGAGSDASTELTLLPEATRDGRATSFATTWTPQDGGEYELTAVDAALGGVGAEGGAPTARVEVITPDDERRTPQADHAALAALAEQTGGAVISPEQLASLGEKLPNRQVRVLGTPEIEPLWNRPGVYVLFMALLTLEWIGRKWLRLA